MIDISISASPNQTFFVQIGDDSYSITLHAADDAMTVSISRDDAVITQGQRIVPGTPLLPYRYQEAGNFMLITNDGDLPDFEQFGVTQFLVYLTAEELATYRAA